jgi:lipopolysaccharide export system protein LptA
VSNFYGEEESVRLTAANGDFHQQKGFLHLEKDVVVTTSSGARLTTDSLDWDRKAQLVSTKDAVNIQKQEMTIIAQGAQGYPDLKKVDLEKEVEVQIKSPGPEAKDKAPTVITCDGPLQIDYQKNIAIFNHNVKVVSDDILIDSDVMDVYFSSGKKAEPSAQQAAQGQALSGSQIERIVARGKVRITQNKNVSYSEEAVYDAATKKITLSGRPKLVIYSSEGMK